MKRTLLALLLLIPGLLHAAAPATLTPSAETRSAIETNEKKLLAAVLAQDKAALDALLAADFVYVHENGLISTKAQFLKDFVAKGYVEAVLTPKEPAQQFGSTVFTIGLGHLRLKGEHPYPVNTVSHIWAEQGGQWLLVHRHECHPGNPIGKQLSQDGGPNLTDKLGSRPSPAVEKAINERSASWVYAMITTDSPRMDKLLHGSLRYLHVNGKLSTKADFMKELLGGFTETDFRRTTMRQFGSTVLVLHQAKFRHTGQDQQSTGQELHVWFAEGDSWVQVFRHSARFEN